MVQTGKEGRGETSRVIVGGVHLQQLYWRKLTGEAEGV